METMGNFIFWGYVLMTLYLVTLCGFVVNVWRYNRQHDNAMRVADEALREDISQWCKYREL